MIKTGTAFLLVLSAVLIVLFGTHLALDSVKDEPDFNMESIVEYQSSTSIAQIAFQCRIGEGAINICLANSDGTGFMQVTQVEKFLDNAFPDINDSGHIVYSCREKPIEDNICISMTDGRGSRQLTSDPGDARENRSPSINDNGIVVYICTDFSPHDSELCMVDSGTGIIEQLTSVNDFRADPIINNEGQIVYICSNEDDGVHNVCALDLENREERQLTFASSRFGNEDTANPSFNDQGLVAYDCADKDRNWNVCIVPFEGGEPVILTQDLHPDGAGSPSINNNNQIAYSCSTSESYSNICIINVDGSRLLQLTTFEQEFWPSWIRMNDSGLIVFDCPFEIAQGEDRICVINSDGSGLRQLLDDVPKGHSHRLPSINN